MRLKTKPGMRRHYRGKINFATSFSFAIDATSLDRVRIYAEREGISNAEAGRRLIDAALEAEGITDDSQCGRDGGRGHLEN